MTRAKGFTHWHTRDFRVYVLHGQDPADVDGEEVLAESSKYTHRIFGLSRHSSGIDQQFDADYGRKVAEDYANENAGNHDHPNQFELLIWPDGKNHYTQHVIVRAAWIYEAVAQ